jgi:protein-tyrosine phosphatase
VGTLIPVTIHWIVKVGVGRLAIMPRPRGGDWLEDEILSLRESGVDVVVSLLQRAEIVELDIELEELVCQAQGISFLSFPITDRTVPSSPKETISFAQSISDLLHSGKNVSIHCRAGIGRSSVIAACVLLLNGMPLDEAFFRIESARGCLVPDTPEQREWVARLAATL